MAISIECSGCKKRLQVKDAMAGKRGKCPSCGQTIVVPVPQTWLSKMSSMKAGRSLSLTAITGGRSQAV